MQVRQIFAECLQDIRCIFNLLSWIMLATYSLNIRRLLTQSIRRRPNLHVKSEHLGEHSVNTGQPYKVVFTKQLQSIR